MFHCLFYCGGWSTARAQGITPSAVGNSPPANGWIPSALALAGVSRLVVGSGEEPVPCWWVVGPHRIALVAHADDPDPEPDAIHAGPIDTAIDVIPDIDPSLRSLLDIARLEDAAALVDGGTGASWSHLLAAMASDNQLRVPPVTGRLPTVDTPDLVAWNPLPFSREATVLLPCPAGHLPWGVTDAVTGASYPVQVVDGALGRQLLATMHLDALERRLLHSHDDPVDGSHWDVSNVCLDNGRVRAEFNDRGQIVRLQCDGIFLPLAGPWLQPQQNGLPLTGTPDVRVVESGPVRSRIAVSIDSADGALQVIYTLHAHDTALQVTASWHGQGAVVLDSPTTLRTGDVSRQWWGCSGSRSVAQAWAGSG